MPASMPAAHSGTFAIGGDLPVHRLGFGTMQLSGPGAFGPGADRDEAVRVLRRAVELGVTLLDTADAYGPDTNEELVAEALHPYAEGLVIATKAGFERPGPKQWRTNGRPEYLRGRVEGSLRRLKVERIDLLQLHRVDPRVPADEQFGALAQFRAEGLVRHVGLSEVSVEQIEAARTVVPIATVQNRYNVGDREHEAVLDHCAEHGIGFIPWYPLGNRKLAESNGPLAEAAARHDATPAQVALAWLLHRSPVLLPIPGTSKVAHLEENVAAAALELSEDELAAIGG